LDLFAAEPSVSGNDCLPAVTGVVLVMPTSLQDAHWAGTAPQAVGKELAVTSSLPAGARL